ncbi:MAG: class I SAM-dependent methyltransferase [archaeon]|jgi:2-polyprenyl-3-methyl-5-hydroxy-6-metoxy-1,4-benzoquinol methylase
MNPKEKEMLVKELYEKYPYPSREVISKQGSIKLSRWASSIIGKGSDFWQGKRVLELGCGTGELTNGITLAGANVSAIDFSSSSIKRAKELSKELGVSGKINFIEKNILEIKKNEFKEKFDVVIALGSLHHTINARKAFSIGCSNLKPEGIIFLGLYNKYSRFRHRVRRSILRVFCGNDIEKRIEFGRKLFGGKESKAWAADKYGQVHESYHSISQILNWFNEEGIEFIASRPKYTIPRIDEIKWFFEKKGAFFVMVGKKSK